MLSGASTAGRVWATKKRRPTAGDERDLGGGVSGDHVDIVAVDGDLRFGVADPAGKRGARYDGGAGQLAKKARIEWMAR
jgi:hypothetical protein